MIIPRLGTVGTIEWDLEGVATDLIRLGIEAYLRDGVVECDQDCFFTKRARLYVSFGRRMGHSTACMAVARNHPDKQFGMVVPNANMGRMLEQEHQADNVEIFNVNSLDRVRGWQFDAVFIDVGWCQVSRGGVTDIGELEHVLTPATQKIVYLFSDFVDTERLKAPLKVRIQADVQELQELGFAVQDLDLAPDYLRPEYR